MRKAKFISAVATAVALCALSAPAAALEPDRGPPHHLRLLAEIGLYLLGGTFWYFSGQDLNAPDWDLEVTGDDLQLKFLGLSQIRLDNNTFLFNQAYHPLAHAGIYLTARANDMGPFLAFAYTFGASAFWEYVGELREKVSINDMIVSPMTGMAWGEVAYQYGEYFANQESRGRTARQVLTAFFGIPRKVHDLMDAERPPVFAQRRFHLEPRASVVAGARHYDADGAVRPLTSVELESQMAVMPGIGQEGRDFQTFRDGNFSTFRGELQFSPDQIELDLDATATVAGGYWRNIRGFGNDRRGFEAMIGGGRGYRLLSRDGDQFKDRVALAHLFGPMARLRLHGPGALRVSIGVDTFFDFSAIRSLAVPQLVSAYGEQVLDGIRTDTKKHSYYFGWGFTFAPSLILDIGRWQAELRTDISRVDSIEGLDRFQEDVTRVIHLDDLVWETAFAVVAPLPPRWLDLRLQGHLEHRRSRLDQFVGEHTYRELEVGLQSRF